MARFKIHVPEELDAEWCSINDAARLLAVSKQMVFELLAAKQLVKMSYLGKRTFVRRASISKFLKTAARAAK